MNKNKNKNKNCLSCKYMEINNKDLALIMLAPEKEIEVQCTLPNSNTHQTHSLHRDFITVDKEWLITTCINYKPRN